MLETWHAAVGLWLRPMNTAPPRLRRAYFECRHGQLHVHNAIPVGGGFDELTTLICLHGAAGTGRMFLELSKRLGSSRSIYSPDLPGCGESDAARGSAVDRRLRRRHRRLPRFHALPPGGLVRRGRGRRGGGGARHRPAKGGAQGLPAGHARQGNRGRGDPARKRCRVRPAEWRGDRRQLVKQPLLALENEADRVLGAVSCRQAVRNSSPVPDSSACTNGAVSSDSAASARRSRRSWRVEPA